MSSLEKDLKPLILCKKNIKKLLQGHYGDEIQLALNPQQNILELIFFSLISSADTVSQIHNINTFKWAGKSLRRAMQTVNLGLDDTFCDAKNLKRSWKNKIIPDKWMIFYFSVF